jgi:hypothetical protein
VLVAIPAVAATVGCGDGVSADRVAAAKCVSGTHAALRVPDGVRLFEQAVGVSHLSGHRKRVTGQVVVDGDGKVHGFTCVVSPDPSDKLRGLRIDSLEVTPPTP